MSLGDCVLEGLLGWMSETTAKVNYGIASFLRMYQISSFLLSSILFL
jgi:hypothetical protein